MKYTSGGIILLAEGDFELTGTDRSMTIKSERYIDTLKGTWNVSFAPGRGAPEKTVLPQLMSWTLSPDEGIRYYSGIGTYEKKFQFNAGIKVKENHRIFLDLGIIAKVGELWFNGIHLGITWAQPHRFDITDVLVQGENRIKVEVANTWSNRLTGDALTDGDFTKTNIRETIVPTAGMETGDQTRYAWSEVPLIESGLLGPVTIQVVGVVDVRKP